jgi:hypothetical protein
MDVAIDQGGDMTPEDIPPQKAFQDADCARLAELKAEQAIDTPWLTSPDLSAKIAERSICINGHPYRVSEYRDTTAGYLVQVFRPEAA